MMACPYCQGDATQELERVTTWGYRLFRCRPWRRTFNERTGTPFNHLQVPTDIALLVVLWRLRYKLSLRDLAEMFLIRGFTFTHETVREWEARFAPLLTERLRAKRRGKAGKKWHCDETYVKVDGRWCYLYRAIDADGTLVDSMLSETRDMDAAKRFFQRARAVVGHVPEKVTTDGHDAYPRCAGQLGHPTAKRSPRASSDQGQPSMLSLSAVARWPVATAQADIGSGRARGIDRSAVHAHHTGYRRPARRAQPALHPLDHALDGPDRRRGCRRSDAE